MDGENVVYCEECNREFNPSEIEFRHANTTIGDKQFEVIYYKCPSCDKTYVVCMLDYWGKKLQDKYVRAIDNYRKLYKNSMNEAKLKQKLEAIEVMKDEAMSYQNELLKAYRDLIPEEVLV